MNILVKTLSSDLMWGAILASIAIILLSLFLTRINVLKQDWKKPINSIVLKIALPALALKGFMKEVTISEIKEESFILGFSFVFYVFLFFISKYVFSWVNFGGKKNILEYEREYKQTEKILMRMMWAFGSTTFFGFPIVQAVYGQNGMITANIFNIAYRVFLYSYCFQQMSGIKIQKNNIKESLTKILKNPVIIATFIGLFLWVLQIATPSFQYKGSEETTFFNFSKTAPWLFKTFQVLAALCSPLIWISIGITLANSNFKESAQDKRVWIYVLSKQILLPAFGLIVLLSFAQINQLNLTQTSISTVVVLLATPPATVVIAYAMQFKKAEQLAAKTSVISTIASVFAMPLWILLANFLTGILL